MLSLYYKMRLSEHKREDFKKYYSDALKNMKSESNNSNETFKCRVCLQKGSIYLLDSDKSDIVETLQIFCNIHLSEDDEYPKHLCKVCYKFIKDAILFRNTAVKADNILRLPVKKEFYNDHSSDHHDFDDNEFKETHQKNCVPISKEPIVEIEKKERPKYNSKVTCHICNKVYCKTYIKEHVTMHEPDHKKYICDVCGKSFRLKSSYRNHSVRHRKDFPYKCKFCPYKAKCTELIKLHMRTHTGDYRYMCTECPARFLFKGNLNRHMLTHKEPQFKCDSCKKAFYTKTLLQEHFEATHLGMKNHVCNLCGKAFGYRNVMMKHQRLIHKREKLRFCRMPTYLQAESDNIC